MTPGNLFIGQSSRVTVKYNYSQTCLHSRRGGKISYLSFSEKKTLGLLMFLAESVVITDSHGQKLGASFIDKTTLEPPQDVYIVI